MCLQVEVQAELFSTLIARVWLLARVNEHMALEFRIVEEALFTALIRALELSIGLRVSFMGDQSMGCNLL